MEHKNISFSAPPVLYDPENNHRYERCYEYIRYGVSASVFRQSPIMNIMNIQKNITERVLKDTLNMETELELSIQSDKMTNPEDSYFDPFQMDSIDSDDENIPLESFIKVSYSLLHPDDHVTFGNYEK